MIPNATAPTLATLTAAAPVFTAPVAPAVCDPVTEAVWSAPLLPVDAAVGRLEIVTPAFLQRAATAGAISALS